MEKTLFLLGLIRDRALHGYQINELLASHFGLIVSITKPTAYRLLNKMTTDGWITFREEQIGNRPPRKIYSITSAGEAAFQRILRQSLAEFNPVEYSNSVSLAFVGVITKAALLPLLEQRRQKILAALQKLSATAKHQGDFQVVFTHQRRHFEAELTSIEEIIAAN
jgi:DNA-binding PadR family transcriptional regulator